MRGLSATFSPNGAHHCTMPSSTLVRNWTPPVLPQLSRFALFQFCFLQACWELPLTTFTLSPKLFVSFFFCQILVCIVCAKDQFPFYKDFVLFYFVTIKPEIWLLIGDHCLPAALIMKGEECIIIVSSCSDHEWQGIVGKTQKIAAPFCWLNYRPESDHFEPSPTTCHCPLKDADSDESGTRGFRWPWTPDLAFFLVFPGHGSEHR